MGAKKITYKTAGVDINKANKLIKDIGKLVDSTRVKGSMDKIGGFGGFFDLKKYGIKDPLLVSSTDGVGTKLKLAIMTGKHDTVGIDLVAMCVNDCLCAGAKPLFFLDYFASGKLEGKVWKDVIKGVVKGCRESGCALLGGETAELPGMYSKGEYDLAGFTVGVVDREKVIDGKNVKAGDLVIGLASSGLHSNGYSLVRKIFTKKELKENVGIFLRPTRLYVRSILDLVGKVKVKAISNITGGGLYDNIPRVLPKDIKARIKEGSWKKAKVFNMIEDKASVSKKELFRTFNMGIGMVVVVSPKDAKKAQAVLKKNKVNNWVIGEVVKGRRGVEIIS